MRCSRIGSLSRAAIAVTLAVSGLSLVAGDDIVAEKTSATSAALPETVRFRGGNLGRIAGRNVGLTIDLGATFDRQVFGRPPANARMLMIVNGVVVQRPREEPAAAADTLAKLSAVRADGEARIAAIDRICRLSPSQRQRLELALTSDLQRLAIRIDSVRQKYAGREFTPAAGGVDRETVVALRADSATCRRWLQQPFGSGALLPAVVGEVLTAEQASAAASLLERRVSSERSP